MDKYTHQEFVLQCVVVSRGTSRQTEHRYQMPPEPLNMLADNSPLIPVNKSQNALLQ